MRSAKMIVFSLLAAFLSFGLVACGGGEETQRQDDQGAAAETPQAQSKRMVMYQYRFNPNTLTVPAGTTVRFVNQDPDQHNVSIPQLNIDQNVPAGETFEHTFETTGEFAVSNRLRQQMQATIVVE